MSAARTTAFRIALGLVVTAALALIVPALREAYAPARELAIAQASGWLAALALLCALAISPLRRIRRALGRPEQPWLLALRRSFGLAAVSCGLTHSAYALASLPGVAEALIELGWLRAGAGALALLSLLFATSFDAVLRRLRLQHWTALHWLVHPAALLVAVHTVLGPSGSPALELAFCGIVALSFALRIPFTRKRRTESIAE